MSLLPLDLTEVVYEELKKDRRPNDHLLHASSHIVSSLRHAQLEVAGAPMRDESIVSLTRLYTGTMWHEKLNDWLRKLGVPYMAEVNVTPWLPDGWGGTADLVIWNPDLKAFVLTDIKTTKGEGLRWIKRDGAKLEHRMQTSAYWYALKKMGIPLARAIGVFYLPMNDTRGDEVIEPLLADFAPVSARELHAEMKRRHKSVRKYVDALPKPNPRPLTLAEYVTPELAPVLEREQRLYFDKSSGTYDLKLVPHWSTAYCKFDHEVCDCSTQRPEKIGWFDLDGLYYHRKGYEHIEPTIFPETAAP